MAAIPFRYDIHTVSVQDLHGVALYNREFGADELAAQEFLETHGQSKDWSMISCSLVPVRTDCFSNFAKDFFLPTFVHRALLINNIFLKILVSVLAIFWDLATLAFRIATAPVRVIYNCVQKNQHPLIEVLDHLPENGLVKIIENKQYHVMNEVLTLVINQKEKIISLNEVNEFSPQKSERTIRQEFVRENDQWTLKRTNIAASSRIN